MMKKERTIETLHLDGGQIALIMRSLRHFQRELEVMSHYAYEVDDGTKKDLSEIERTYKYLMTLVGKV